MKLLRLGRVYHENGGVPDMSDAELFEAFVRRHENMVYGTAVRLVGQPADAEDIAQNVFLKAFEHFSHLEASQTAAGWLKTVTTNACLNFLTRHRARWRLFSELANDADGGSPFEARLVAATPDPVADTDADAVQVERALRALPDHQRVPLVLYHFEDRSYQEIADLLRISLGKVKTDIHRGREALRRRLTHAAS